MTSQSSKQEPIPPEEVGSVKDKLAWLNGAFKEGKDDEMIQKTPVTPVKKKSSLIQNRMKWLEEEKERKNVIQTSSPKVDPGNGSLIQNRMQWLKEEKERKNVIQTSTKKDQGSGKNGLIERQKEWLKQENENAQVIQTSTKKDQGNTRNNGLIERQKEWLKQENENAQVIQTSSSKDQGSCNGGLIERQKEWLKQENENAKVVQTSSSKDQDVGGSGIIDKQKEWLKEQNEKDVMTAAVKDQHVGSGIIARQKEWVKEESKRQLEAQVATQKDQNVGSGIIEKQKEWLKEENEKDVMTAAVKDQHIGSGIIARQTEWVKEESKRQMEAQVASQKDQNVGSGIIEKQKQWVDEQRQRMATAQVAAKEDHQVSNELVTDRLQWVEQEKQRFQAQGQMDSPKSKARVKTPESPTSVSDIGGGGGGGGCYLTYENDSGGRLMLFYKRDTENPPENAVGFWSPGHGKVIQDFKFKQAGGRSELIKGIAGCDANRKKYFAGWCQFLKQAKAMDGQVRKFNKENKQGVEVDIYAFQESHPSLLDLDDEEMVDISSVDAVAVLPKHKAFLQGVKSMVLPTFLEKGNLAGASTTL